MSYKSDSFNKFHIYFCSSCDELLCEGAFKNKKNGKLFCSKCVSKFSQQQYSSPTLITENNREEFVENECVQEISECLKMIEKTFRVARNKKDTSKKQMKIERDCQNCLELQEIEKEEYGKGKQNEEVREVNKANLFCINDGILFCLECYNEVHKSGVLKRHKTLSIEDWWESIGKFQEQKKTQLKGNLDQNQTEWFCEEHKTNPLFCDEEQILFCVECVGKNHEGHKMTLDIKKKASDEKQRIKIEKITQTCLSERLSDLCDIEMIFFEFIEFVEKQKRKSQEMIETLKKKLIELRETKEHWREIEEELNEKEWCNKEFVEKIESQIKRVEEKWREREREMRTKSKDMIVTMRKNLEDFEKVISMTKRERINLVVSEISTGQKLNNTHDGSVPSSESKDWWGSMVKEVESDMNETIKYCRQSAEQGEAKGLFNLGWCFETGQGVERNMKEAVRYYRMSSRQGYSFAYFKLGILAMKGYGAYISFKNIENEYLNHHQKYFEQSEKYFKLFVDQQNSQGVKYVRMLADQENSDCQLILGLLYLKGIGITKDEFQGLKYIQQSIEKGNEFSQLYLLLMYLKGIGVKKDEKEGMRFLKQFAEQGNTYAQCILGECLVREKYGEKDLNEAKRYFKISSEKGNQRAQINLCLFYLEEKEGVEKDEKEGLRLLKMYSDQGNELAKFLMTYAIFEGKFGIERDDKEGIRILKQDSEQGYELSQVILIIMYFQGIGVEKDEKEGIRIAKYYSEQGNTYVHHLLGDLYENGKYLDKDINEAIKYYRIAVENGMEEVQEDLERCLNQLT